MGTREASSCVTCHRFGTQRPTCRRVGSADLSAHSQTGRHVSSFFIQPSAFGVRAKLFGGWYKIAGGGRSSTGCTYQVSGTIGQPDAKRRDDR